MNILERINQKETIYVCYDSNGVQFGSPSNSQANRYARLNNCEVSIYPPKCYMHDKENRLNELIYKTI